MFELPSFTDLATAPHPRMDLLSLALAAEFHEVDSAQAIGTLDRLGNELSLAAASASTTESVLACARLLGAEHGFEGDRSRYDAPENSMLDLVLSRRRGLPILLSVVYVEVARRARIALDGVGLPGHFVVGHFGSDPPLLLDPFSAGRVVDADVPRALIRPWRAHEIAMRMLNNLVAAYDRRGDLGAAIRAATMRVMLPADPSMHDAMRAELQALRAQLN